MLDINLLKEIFEKLIDEKVNFCVVGGIALNLYGIDRKTSDLDLFIEPEKDNFKKVIKCLYDIFQDEELKEIKEEDIQYQVIRYTTPAGFNVDLIMKVGEMIDWEEVEKNIEWMEIEEGLKIPVASINLLIKMKEGASKFRERDKVDLYWLNLLKKMKIKKNDKKV